MDMLKKIIENRPQRLCKKCGKCCRIVAIDKSYSELKYEAENGKTESIEFLDTFIPYPSIDDVLKIDRETVENIEDWNLKTFYKCKYLRDDNLCSIYEDRFDSCKNYPKSPFLELPEGCGFEGWAFQEGEKIKQTIRKLKEELLNYETEYKTTKNSKEKNRLQKLINITNSKIEKYETILPDYIYI